MPSTVNTTKIDSLLQRNQKYTETYTSPGFLMDGVRKRPAGSKGTVIISCSDPRIHPEKFFNLNFGEAAIIRNAGGRTSDVLRSLLSLDAVGRTGLVIVVHHTDCGMSHTNEAGFLKSALERHAPILKEASSNKEFIFGAIEDPEKTVIEDVKFLKSYPTLVENMDIVGMVLDTFTGVLKVIDV